MDVGTKVLGHLDRQSVRAFVLDDQQGSRAKVVEYGATLAELHLLDARSRSTDLVLGFDTLDSYLSSKSYFGSTVGRYANRIKNGAADSRITWKQADALKLPFENESFDSVCCQFRVMFFPHRVAGYKEALRVLRPAGASSSTSGIA